MFNKEARQSYLPSPVLQLFDKLVRQCYLPSQTGSAELPTLTCTAIVWARCSTKRQRRATYLHLHCSCLTNKWGSATYPHLHCNCLSQVFNKQARQRYLPSPALQLLEPGVQQTGKAELPTLTCIATVAARCSTNRQGSATYPHLHCSCLSQVFKNRQGRATHPRLHSNCLRQVFKKNGEAELPALIC